MLMDGFSKTMKLLILLGVLPFLNGNKIIYTENGPVKGTSLTSKKVEAFLSIPYAEPPVGPLRFAKPVPKSPWKEIYDASELPPACIQAIIGEFYFAIDPKRKMDENCLYLNLWVPEGGSDVKPIMIFIHGGGYMLGSSNMQIYDGSTIAERGDVIVASINYRVGTLGFFTSFQDEAPGSMGMYDQIMAIKWIKDNAKHFHGDPDNIVLFGESAGGFCISLHMISPLSKNLFRRAILQSGSALNPRYSDDNEPLSESSHSSAKISGCADDNDALGKNPKSVVECMKNLPAEKFSETDFLLLVKGSTFFPRVGDDFLPKNPIDLFRQGKFKDSELLMGVNRDEGSMLLATMKPLVFGMFGEKVDSVAFNESIAKETLKYFAKKGVTKDEVIQLYLDKVKDESRYNYLNAMSEVVGDFIINCGMIFQADFHSLKKNPVYFYLFDYRSPSSPFAEWIGATHFDEVQYVFGNPINGHFTEFEEELSNDIIDMWVNFAKMGNPNIPGGLEWPLYTYKDPKYFIIGQTDKVGVKPDNYRCEVWREFFRSQVDSNVIQDLDNSTD